MQHNEGNMTKSTVFTALALALSGCGTKPEGDVYWDCVRFWEHAFECEDACGVAVWERTLECGSEDDLELAVRGCDEYDLTPCDSESAAFDADECEAAHNQIERLLGQRDDPWSIDSCAD